MNQVFNKDLKMNYRWLPKGVTSSIINQVNIGNKNLIAAYWSDGEYIWATLNQAVNSEWFESFLWIVKHLLKTRKLDINKDVTLVLDNASYHSLNYTKERLADHGFNTKFLLSYSPSLAPVEQLFKIIKSKIRAFEIKREIKLNSILGTDLIQKASSSIKSKTLKNVWKDPARTAFQLITDIN